MSAEVIKNMMRSVIEAPEGMEFLVGDYSAIEARVAFWYAGCTRALEGYRNKVDLYCDMAQDIYHREITKADRKERNVGKAAVLGCQYGMGKIRFQESCAANGIFLELDEAERAVRAYRSGFSEIPRAWKEAEQAFLRTREGAVNVGPMVLAKENIASRIVVTATFPNGRKIHYWEPWKDANGISFLIRVGKSMVRKTSWGGDIFQDWIQGIARDLMYYSWGKMPKESVIMSVHDELVLCVPKDSYTLDKFEQDLSEIPQWAEGLPMAVECWKGRYYRK